MVTLVPLLGAANAKALCDTLSEGLRQAIQYWIIYALHRGNADQQLAGPAGATLASRLARSAAHPLVLLVEAGGPNNAKSITIDAERWLTRMNPDQNWGYETVPQDHLDGLVVGYDRGKGIGGSSSINYCKWNDSYNVTDVLMLNEPFGIGALETISRR